MHVTTEITEIVERVVNYLAENEPVKPELSMARELAVQLQDELVSISEED